MNENPKKNPKNLEDRLAAMKRGKSGRIVVQGNCRVCNRRSSDVPSTPDQALAWFTEGDTTGFLKYEIRMLKSGVHRDCQRVEDGLKPLRAKPNTIQQVIAVGERAHAAKVMARRQVKQRVTV